MNKPKDWWRNSKNAEKWIEQNKRRTDASGENTTVESTNIVIAEILKRKDFKKILEVGSGDGRLIGPLSDLHLAKCSSCDINTELSAYVHEKYLNVGTYAPVDVADMPFKRDTFDLVYTYQMLQHVHPDDIGEAIKELCRVGKEVWMWEGIGRVDYPHGAQTHSAHNGSFVYHIDKMVDCYEVNIPQNDNIKLDRQRLYKVRTV